MENFKLDLSKLTPVPEKDRVRGNWYVIADNVDSDTPIMVRWHSGCHSMRNNGEISIPGNHWFAIPSNLPGFPVQELPDEFELKEGEYEYYSDYYKGWSDISKLTDNEQIKFRRKPTKLPTLSIPEQTASERREWLQKELERLNSH